MQFIVDGWKLHDCNLDVLNVCQQPANDDKEKIAVMSYVTV